MAVRKSLLWRSAHAANRVFFQVIGESFHGFDTRILDAPINDPDNSLAVDPGMTRGILPLGFPTPQTADDPVIEASHVESVGHVCPIVKTLMPQRSGYANPMAKKKMRGAVESIIGENLDALMAHFPQYSSNHKVGDKAKLPARTIGRIRNAEVSCSVDTLAKIAAVFGVEPWAMLVDKYDPKNPPVRTITQAERDFYAQTKKAFESLPDGAPASGMRKPARASAKP